MQASPARAVSISWPSASVQTTGVCQVASPPSDSVPTMVARVSNAAPSRGASSSAISTAWMTPASPAWASRESATASDTIASSSEGLISASAVPSSMSIASSRAVNFVLFIVRSGFTSVS